MSFLHVLIWRKLFKERTMKILMWAIIIIFLIGLLVVTGVLKLIF